MNFALIGFPLGHSVSPFIHEHLFKLNNISATYCNHEISPDDLNIREFMKDFDGINVTIPHKTAVIPFLDELCGKAKYLKTVNTIHKKDGKLYGYNTDADGFLKSLELADITLSGKVLLCGAGGTARMMCCVAADMGCDVTVSARRGSEAKAQSLADEVSAQFGCDIKVKCNEDIDEDFDLLLNATPAGMFPKNIDKTPVPERVIDRCGGVFDAVYNPKMTKLLKIASANGAKTALGMPMLVYQAAVAESIWLGVDFNDNDLSELIELTDRHIQEQF